MRRQLRGLPGRPHGDGAQGERPGAAHRRAGAQPGPAAATRCPMNQRARIERLERALPPLVPNEASCQMCGGIGGSAAIVLVAPAELAAWYWLEECPRCGRGLVVIPDNGRDPDVAAVVMARRALAPPAPPPDAPDLAALTRLSDTGGPTHDVRALSSPTPAKPQPAPPSPPPRGSSLLAVLSGRTKNLSRLNQR